MAISLPKVDLARVRKWVGLVFLVVIVFSAGYFLGLKGFVARVNSDSKVTISRELPPDSNLDFALFWRVWDLLEEKYFDKSKIVERELVYGAIRGMVAAVGDPYTVFLAPTENRVVQEDLRGTFEGVGIQIGFKGNQLAVIAPLPGSPAEKSGVKAGDFIVGIKDEAKGIDRGTVGISLPEAVQAIRGKAGSKVTLALLRDDASEPQIIEITREKLDVPSVTLTFVGTDSRIAHLKLLKFGGETNGEWSSAVSEITSKQNLAGVILDLRNNPGGYLQGSVDTASEFLKSGSVVVIEERSDGTKEEYKVEKIGKLQTIKIVVLVNEGSASASEILAGALRDNLGTKLVGEKTFGKGTIQEPLQLENGSGLHVTSARWLTPKGTWVNETGLDPDVKIEDDTTTSQDEQLNEAIKIINS